MSFDFEKWLDAQWPDKGGVDTRTIHIRGAYREFKPLIEAVRLVVRNTSGSVLPACLHAEITVLHQALRDLGIEP